LKHNSNNSQTQIYLDKIKCLVILHDLKTNELMDTIIPPFFENVSCLKLSSSGSKLIIGNEQGQYFYVYEIYFSSNLRHYNKNNKKIRTCELIYSLFRGYTNAFINQVLFSNCEQWVCVSTSHGTAHIFNIERQTYPSISYDFENNGEENKFDDDPQRIKEKIMTILPEVRVKYQGIVSGKETPVCSYFIPEFNYGINKSKKDFYENLGGTFTVEGENMVQIPLFITLTNETNFYYYALLAYNTLKKGVNPTLPEKEYLFRKKYEIELLSKFIISFSKPLEPFVDPLDSDNTLGLESIDFNNFVKDLNDSPPNSLNENSNPIKSNNKFNDIESQTNVIHNAPIYVQPFFSIIKSS